MTTSDKERRTLEVQILTWETDRYERYPAARAQMFRRVLGLAIRRSTLRHLRAWWNRTAKERTTR